MAYDYNPARVYEKGYLYALTGELNKQQIYTSINKALSPILNRNIRISINVVKNREDKTCGHSYLWTPELDVYELLCGKNPDGSERITYIDDPQWKAPEEELDLKDVSDWGMLAQSEPNKIKLNLDPLFEFEPIDGYTISIMPAFWDECTEFENAIVCTKVPRWVTNEMIKRRFIHYEQDKREHYTKKRKNFTYPIIDRNKGFCKIIFSSLNSKTAFFAVRMTKKLIFKDGLKEKLLHFYLFKKDSEEETFGM